MNMGTYTERVLNGMLDRMPPLGTVGRVVNGKMCKVWPDPSKTPHSVKYRRLLRLYGRLQKVRV